ncbi:hypothetical protein [Burkholderia pyrrocinia]|nr:hypothetical protein [Burkholderia pyrrocinia]
MDTVSLIGIDLDKRCLHLHAQAICEAASRPGMRFVSQPNGQDRA